MKLKYIINDDPAHYVMITLDPAAKTAAMEYVKSSGVQQTRNMSIAEVIDLEKTKNPQVQVAKRGYIWDLHVFKVDVNGNELRRTLSIATPTQIISTKLEMINDGTTDITLKDYITQPLDVYTSRLTLVEKTFDTTDGLIGQSGNTSTTPVVTPDGYLELGNNAQVTVPLAANVDLNTTGFTLVCGVASLGANDVSGDYQLGIKLGSGGTNWIKFDVNKGVLFSSASASETAVLPTTAWASRIDMMLEYADGNARLFVNGMFVPLPSFVKTETVDAIVLTSMCNDQDTTRVDYLLVQKLKG